MEQGLNFVSGYSLREERLNIVEEVTVPAFIFPRVHPPTLPRKVARCYKRKDEKEAEEPGRRKTGQMLPIKERNGG